MKDAKKIIKESLTPPRWPEVGGMVTPESAANIIAHEWMMRARRLADLAESLCMLNETKEKQGWTNQPEDEFSFTTFCKDETRAVCEELGHCTDAAVDESCDVRNHRKDYLARCRCVRWSSEILGKTLKERRHAK